MCERWVILSHGRTLLREMLPKEMLAPGATDAAASAIAPDDEAPLGPQLAVLQAAFERTYLHRVLQRHRGKLQVAAAHAGITRRTLYTKLKEYGLDASSYRQEGEEDED
jgi:DNA-binding NtrC family response regulator